MTSIKPPIGPATTVPASVEKAPSAGPSSDFRAALGADEARLPSATAETTQAGPLGSLAASVESGETSPAQALETLVRSALAGPMAAGLTSRGRQELEARLRDALASDPSIRAMVADLERAR